MTKVYLVFPVVLIPILSKWRKKDPPHLHPFINGKEVITLTSILSASKRKESVTLNPLPSRERKITEKVFHRERKIKVKVFMKDSTLFTLTSILSPQGRGSL